MKLYAESSAALAWLLEQEHGELVADTLAQAELIITSDLTLIECDRVLIRAVAHLMNEGLDLELWIAGEGGRRKALQSLIDGLGQSPRIKLLGHVDDTQGFFESLNVFALSSLREGLPSARLRRVRRGVLQRVLISLAAVRGAHRDVDSRLDIV